MVSRVSRVGVGFLLIGVFAAVLSVVVVPAFISSFTFHGGVLVLSLGAATIAVEPTSPRDVLIATAVGVTGLVGLAVSVVPAAKEPTDRWTLDLVCHDCGRGVPPSVCTLLSEHDLALRSASPQGPEQRQVLAVA